MSKFSFIASNSPLPEVDHTGFVRMKVRDFKKLNIKTSGLISIDNIDEDSEMLYAEDETKLNDLRISLCKNPPYDLEMYINKEFIYWLDGFFEKSSCKDQFFDYLLALDQSKTSNLEVWSIWFGDGKQRIRYRTIKLSTLQSSDLEILKEVNFCIRFE